MATIIVKLKVQKWRFRIAHAAILMIAPFIRTEEQAEAVSSFLGRFVAQGFKVSG
jgi:hypothetical protein